MPTVLVVDDEPLVLQMVSVVLEQQGYSVLTAEGGTDALSLSQSHPGQIDLLVSDVVMPGMDGPTLATKLLAQNPKLPILFMSACCDTAAVGPCRGFPFLSKPFSIAILLSTVQTLLRQGSLRAGH
jgi:two-component system cell cycle sensor histidine kinase/response regulator CckA